MSNPFPYIDERVEHVGVTRLRVLNVAALHKLEKVIVIQDNGTPLAVLLPYSQFIAMQNALRDLEGR